MMMELINVHFSSNPNPIMLANPTVTKKIRLSENHRSLSTLNNWIWVHKNSGYQDALPSANGMSPWHSYSSHDSHRRQCYVLGVPRVGSNQVAFQPSCIQKRICSFPCSFKWWVCGCQPALTVPWGHGSATLFFWNQRVLGIGHLGKS